MNVPRYFMDREGDPEFHEDGNWVEWNTVDPLLRTISQLTAQLKHNSDRDSNRGFEDGLRAGLNGG